MVEVFKAFGKGFAVGLGAVLGFFGMHKWRHYADSKDHPNRKDKAPNWENIET